MDGASCGSARPKRVRGERQRLQDAQWRQRKKQERQQLKDTAQRLEAQLAQLQKDKDDGVCCGVSLPPPLPVASPVAKRRKGCCNWREEAEAMKQERIQAELLNMTLRRAMATEQRVAKSLRALMDKRPYMPVGSDCGRVNVPVQRSIVYDMRSRASCSQAKTYPPVPQLSPCCNPTTLHINPTAVRHEIEATLQRMHAHAQSVLSSDVGYDSLSFNFNLRVDPVAGPTTEVTTTTPMNCSLDQAVLLLGSKLQIQGTADRACLRCVQDPRRWGDGANVQQFAVEIGAPYQTVLLDGFGANRKSGDTNHRLIMRAAISFDRCGALCFRECSWIAVYRSRSNPIREAMIRSYYSVAAEKAVECTSIDGEHIDGVRDRLQTSMGRKIKERYLIMQRGILVQTGRADLVDFVGLLRSDQILLECECSWDVLIHQLERPRMKAILRSTMQCVDNAMLISRSTASFSDLNAPNTKLFCRKMKEEPVKLSEMMEIIAGFDDDRSLHDHDLYSSVEESNTSSSGDRNEMTMGGSTVLLTGVFGNMRRPRRKRIRKVGSVPYSTDLQRRRRAELVSLRSEAQGLEDKLAQLRRQYAGKVTSSTEKKCEKWCRIAEIALKERQCSEHTNQKLKECVSSRLKALSTIRKLVTKNNILEGKEFVFREAAKSSHFLATTREANFLKSHKKRHKMRDSMGYNCIETISVTPVSWTILKAWMSLLEQLIRRKDTEPESSTDSCERKVIPRSK